MKMPSKAVLHTVEGTFVLLLTSVLFFYYTTWRLKKEVGTGAFEQQFVRIVEQLNNAVDSVQQKIEPVSNSNTALLESDPAQTNTVPAPDNESLGIVLQGIFWSELTPLAMLNNQIYQVGDQIGGLTLIDIRPHHVLLKDGTGTIRKMNLMEESR